MGYRIILAATEDAYYSSQFAVPSASSATMIQSNGYGSDTTTEYAILQFYDPIIDEWVNVNTNGNPTYLNADNNMVNTFTLPGQYRFYKTATATAVGITQWCFGTPLGLDNSTPAS